MSDDIKMTGGCMCGQVRYETTGEPFAVTHCHCLSCRKHNGGPVVTLAGFLSDQVQFSGTERNRYESTANVFRAFCGDCGTPLTWEGDDEELGMLFELHISTFDEPEKLVPTAHAFANERIPWFDIADELPRFEGFADYSPLLHHGSARQKT